MGSSEKGRNPALRIRPGWHRVVGWLSLAAGLAIIALNDTMQLASGITLLPGGHSELYLLAGIAVTGTSLWWFGWMDRAE
ncbi:hypothetical protein [Promicromonospora soli]